LVNDLLTFISTFGYNFAGFNKVFAIDFVGIIGVLVITGASFNKGFVTDFFDFIGVFMADFVGFFRVFGKDFDALLEAGFVMDEVF